METKANYTIDRETLEEGIKYLTEAIDALLYAAKAAHDGKEVTEDFLTIPAMQLSTFKVSLQTEMGGI